MCLSQVSLANIGDMTLSIPTLRRVSLLLCCNAGRGTRPGYYNPPRRFSSRELAAPREFLPVAMAYRALYMG